MYWKYGNYAFDPYAVSFAFEANAKLDTNGIPYGYMPQYTLTGEVRITDTGSVTGNQAAMTTKLAELEAALSQPFQDLVLYDAAGNQTVHKLINANTLGGVRVMRFRYPTSQGAEYATHRTFEAVFSAEQPTQQQAGGGGRVIEWRESLTFVGTGGPEFVMQQMIEGDPIQQQVAQRTTIQAAQEGQSLGYAAYIDFPEPLFGVQFEHQKRRVRGQGTGRYLGPGVVRELPRNWAHFYEFPTEQAIINPTGRPS